MSERSADLDAFREYFLRVNYKQRYPAYASQYRRSLSRKALEHFISFELMGIGADKVYVDVAGSTSPVQSILTDVYGVKLVYKQDWNFQPNTPNFLWGPASKMELADESVDFLMLHNSWEHFEGDEDLAFLREATRVLRPGGMVCILPLELSEETQILTSPAIWLDKYASIKSLPTFDKRAKVFINENKKQRQEKYFSVKDLVSDLAKVPLKFELVRFSNLADDSNALQAYGHEDCKIGDLTHLAEIALIGRKV